MKNALYFLAVIVVVLLAVFLGQSKAPVETGSSVVIENGVQTIFLTAKEGYSPQAIVATSGIPTNLVVKTRGTYDCSASLVIPKLRTQMILPPVGETVIPIPETQTYGTLDGACSMGMYRFSIDFTASS